MFSINGKKTNVAFRLTLAALRSVTECFCCQYRKKGQTVHQCCLEIHYTVGQLNILNLVSLELSIKRLKLNAVHNIVHLYKTRCVRFKTKTKLNVLVLYKKMKQTSVN